MTTIENYKQNKRTEAVDERNAAMIRAGYSDPDGTMIVDEETWNILSATGSTEGFRLETEIDRARMEKIEREDPEAVTSVFEAIAKQRKYR